MEFNEHLQRQLIQKEGSVKRLTVELIELRGPVSKCVCRCCWLCERMCLLQLLVLGGVIITYCVSVSVGQAQFLGVVGVSVCVTFLCRYGPVWYKAESNENWLIKFK